MKPVELVLIMRDKTRQSLLEAGKNVDDLSDDYEELIKMIRASESAMERSGKTARNLGSDYGGLQSMLMKIGGTAALAKFGKDVINVRGELEMLDKSFEVLTGSAEKSQQILSQLKDYAIISPLTLKDISSGAQILMGYNIEAERTVDIIKQIGDISMGDSQKFQSLLLAYSQMSSAGKVLSQDLRQMATAGFNPLVEVARTAGKTIEELTEQMSDGAISVDVIQEAFRSATAEGGKFYQMSEKQAEGLVGLKASLEDAWMNMLNEIGKSNQDLIAEGYKLTTSLIQNYEKIGKVLLSLVATYGTYKASVLLNIVVEQGWMTTQMQLGVVAARLNTIIKTLNATMMNNPAALVASVIVGLVTAVWALKDSTSAEDKALKSLNDEMDKYNQKVNERKNKADELIRLIKDETETEEAKVRAIKKLQELYPAIFGKMDIEAVKLANEIDLKKKRNQEEEKYTAEKYKQMIADAETEKVNKEKTLKELTEEQAYNPSTQKGARILNLQKEITETTAKIKEHKNALENFNKVQEEAANNESNTVFSNLNDELKAAQKNVDDLKKKLEDLRSGKAESTNYATDIEKTAEALATAEKKLASLTGKDKKTIGNEESAREKQLKAEKEYAEALLDIQIYINSKKVELIQDGIQKEKEEIAKGYKDELRSIDKLRDKAIQEYNEKNKLKGDKAVTAENYETKVPDLATEINAASIAASLNARKKMSDLNKQAVEEVQKVINETDEIFRSHLEIQTEQIKKEYDERKKVIIKNVEDIEEQKRLLASLDEKEGREIDIAGIDNTLKSLDIKKEVELEKQKLVNKTYLFETDKAQALLKIEKDSATTRLQLLQELKEKGVQGLEDEIDLLIEKIAEMNTELEKMPTQKFQEALSCLKQVAGALSQFGGEAGQIFGALGSSIDSISSSLDFSDKLKEDGASISDYAGQISSAISGIVNIINTISEASSKRKQVEKEFYKNQIALAHEYALALNEQLRTQSEMSGSGFIKDYAGKLNDGFKALEDAVSGYEKALGKLAEGKAKVDLRNAIDWGSVGKGAASGAAVGAAIGSVIPVIGTAIGAVVGAIGGFFAGMFGGKKKKDVTAGLLDVFPELVDSAGNLNRELARTLINTNQVDDATKQIIQNALDWADAVDAANEQIKEVVVELSGDLGNSLRDAIVDAFKSGEDASKRMFDAASKSMENFIENLLYSTIFSDVFEDFGEMLRDSLDANKESGDILDAFDWLISQMDERDDTFVAILDSFKKRAAERGFEMWQNDDAASSSSQKGKVGAFTTMTQDQAGKLEGLFTSLQNHTANIDENVINISDAMYDVLETLSAIAENTEFCRRLDDIADNIEKIIRDGLKVK